MGSLLILFHYYNIQFLKPNFTEIDQVQEDVLWFKPVDKYVKDGIEANKDKEAIITAGKLYYGAYIKRSMDRSGTAKFSGYIKEVFSEKYCITFLGRSVKSLFEVIQWKLKK